MDKLISIIIPCYNAEAYIDRCFQSILSQTIGFDKLEVILIDDCSTDHTWEKLTEIEASYPDDLRFLLLTLFDLFVHFIQVKEDTMGVCE